MVWALPCRISSHKSRSLKGCGHCGHRPNLISLGCSHLPVPFNCPWGVSFDGPYNEAEVVNLLKTSVRKGDTEEDVEWRRVMHWASTGDPLFLQQESPDEAGDTDNSELEVEEVPHPQTPKPEALNFPFFGRWGCRSGCRCQFMPFFFPFAICSLLPFGLFLLLPLLFLTLPLRCLLLLPQLALSLLLLLLAFFIGFPLLGHCATWFPGWLIQEQRQEQRQVTGGPTYRWIMIVAEPYQTYHH